ncbi:hypothetical protein K438DRAFT_1601975 [Mycena galopus ATCC 62051]|nr:hypothetical protein K438DRAFT_1601975 [Mycena galopus ATCC 62051]
MVDPTSATVALFPRASLVPLDNFLGAWLIGLILSSVLYGITCLQVYLYFTKHGSRDRVFLRYFVAVLMALDTLQLAFISHSFYFDAVTNFGDYENLVRPPWWVISPFSTVNLVGTMVQLFYAYRIYILSNKSRVFPSLIVSDRLCPRIAFLNKTFQLESFKLVKGDVPYSTSSLAFEAGCDTLIAGAMTYYLTQNRSEFRKTNKIINLPVLYSVNSGAITMVLAIACLVAWAVWTTTLIYGLFYFLLVRFYALSFMSILNSREYIREQMDDPSHAMLTFPSFVHNTTTVPTIPETKTSEAVAV